MPTLTGSVERITFANEDSQYRVIRMKIGSEDRTVTVVGQLPLVQPGESLTVEGDWVSHPQFGRQFHAQSAVRQVPTSREGIVRFLGSGLIKGIGQATARKLVETFGDAVLDVIENFPERLHEVQGIGTQKIDRIVQGYKDHHDVREVMIYLQGHGVSPALATRIYRTYGRGSIDVIKSNPYRLARDVYGIGFKTADAIARTLGLALDAPERLAAGILFTLQKASSDGHVYVPRLSLIQQASVLLGVDESLVGDAYCALKDSHAVVVEDMIGPSASGEESVYLGPLYQSERGTVDHLLRINRTPDDQPLDATIDEMVQEAERSVAHDLAPEQRLAVRQFLTNRVLIVTGGPGTGKTTTVQALLSAASLRGWRVELAAPTGRAAKRLAEATGREARTIHRLLDFGPGEEGFTFQYHAHHPLHLDVLIVDEVSMLDVVLAHHLLKAVPSNARIVLVGDVDQLPSVGPGQVLADLIDGGCLPVVRLSTIFRQAEQSVIVQNAHRINRGLHPLAGRRDSDFFFVEEEDPDRARELIAELYSVRLPAYLGERDSTPIQVLSPMRKGHVGIDALNEHLQARLNPVTPDLVQHTHAGRDFRVGDKVMQMRNDYQRDVYNGDIGWVTRLDEDEAEVTVSYPTFGGDREVKYAYADLDELQHAYCISVHKSQGSEFPAVILSLSVSHYVMLERNLVYTAITRAKRLVVIVGSRAALSRAIQHHTVRQRNSHLADRLRAWTMSK